MRGNPVVNVDFDGLQSEGLVRLGGVSTKINSGAEAMRQFNNAHALELGYVVTKVERLPSKDWLMVETKPLSPSLRATAERLHGDLETAQLLESLTDTLGTTKTEFDGDPAPSGGETPGQGATGGDGSAGTQVKGKGGDNVDPGDGTGGKGTKGKGKDGVGKDGGPPQEGNDLPPDQSAKDGEVRRPRRRKWQGRRGVRTAPGAHPDGRSSMQPRLQQNHCRCARKLHHQANTTTIIIK